MTYYNLTLDRVSVLGIPNLPQSDSREIGVKSFVESFVCTLEVVRMTQPCTENIRVSSTYVIMVLLKGILPESPQSLLFPSAISW